MSQAERSDRLNPERLPTAEDLRQLMGAATPHFALQIRSRIRALVDRLPEDHPLRKEGECEIARLEELAQRGEQRGISEPFEVPLPSASLS